MTHSVHFVIMHNKLSQTCCTSSQQANSVIPYASADAKMHPYRGLWRRGPPCHGAIGTMVNPPWVVPTSITAVRRCKDGNTFVIYINLPLFG